VDVSQLPWWRRPQSGMEKAVSIGTWAVAMGLPTHVGVVPPVTAARLVVQCSRRRPRTCWRLLYVEPDPKCGG